MLSNRSDSQSRARPQKNRQIKIQLISNTLALKHNQRKLVSPVRNLSHSKSKSFSLLSKDTKEGIRGIKYCTGGIGEEPFTERDGIRIEHNPHQNDEKLFKTSRDGKNDENSKVNPAENREYNVNSEKKQQNGHLQIQDIILGSAYFKPKPKEVSKLKIQLKRI